jgi:hypothetical protein
MQLFYRGDRIKVTEPPEIVSAAPNLSLFK